MRIIKWIAFTLLAIGTTGLLVSEFVTHWGTTATLIFAIFNISGLIIIIYFLQRKA